LTRTLPDLTDTAELLQSSNTWDTSSLVDRNLLITTGPWIQATKTIAWETFLEREGLPTHECCPVRIGFTASERYFLFSKNRLGVDVANELDLKTSEAEEFFSETPSK